MGQFSEKFKKEIRQIAVQLFGSRHDREMKVLDPIKDEIIKAYQTIQDLSNDELRGKTAEFKQRIHDAVKDIESSVFEKRLQMNAGDFIATVTPQGLLYSEKEHLWVRPEEDFAYLGITSFEAMHMDSLIIDSIDFKVKGTEGKKLKKGEPICTINTIESVIDNFTEETYLKAKGLRDRLNAAEKGSVDYVTALEQSDVPTVFKPVMQDSMPSFLKNTGNFTEKEKELYRTTVELLETLDEDKKNVKVYKYKLDRAYGDEKEFNDQLDKAGKGADDYKTILKQLNQLSLYISVLNKQIEQEELNVKKDRDQILKQVKRLEFMPAIKKYLDSYLQEMESYIEAKELSGLVDKAIKEGADYAAVLEQMRGIYMPAIRNHFENAYEKEKREFSPKLPFDAEIVEFNPQLVNDPQLIRTDPYGAGWIVKVKVSNRADIQIDDTTKKEHSKEDCLLDANAYIDTLTLSPEEKESINREIEKLNKEAYKKKEEVLNDILPEAFAVVKETARRFKDNATIEVTATQHDRHLAVRCEYITIEKDVTGKIDKAIYQNKWIAGGNMIEWNMCHYDVQLIGGTVLHQGKIAEMATGEGKTLVATLPVYLNALAGNGVHMVTVNDYLAKRDSEWMGTIYEFLGLTVDCIDKHEPNSTDRRNAYLSDITYGTNSEFGFDYLRDNMARNESELVQRPIWKESNVTFSPKLDVDTFSLAYIKGMRSYAENMKMYYQATANEVPEGKLCQPLHFVRSQNSHHYAIVDEVDSILIDDARTPLIISGPIASKRDDDEEMFKRYNDYVKKMVDTQRELVGRMFIEARKLILSNPNIKKDDFGAILLLRCYRGLPKHPSIVKFLTDPRIKELMMATEGEFMKEHERYMFQIDNDLTFSDDELNEKIHHFNNRTEDYSKSLASISSLDEEQQRKANESLRKDAVNLRKELLTLIENVQKQIREEIEDEDPVKFAESWPNIVRGYMNLAYLNQMAGNEPEQAPKSFDDYRDMIESTLNDLVNRTASNDSKSVFNSMLKQLQGTSAAITEDFRLAEMVNVKHGKYGLYFVIEEKLNSVNITERGIENLSSNVADPELFVMPETSTMLSMLEKENLDSAEKERRAEAIRDEGAAASERIHTVQQLLRAYTMFEKDVHYIVDDNKVKIVDEQTGRVMEGRRYSEGLHQAIEAKEKVKVENGTQTYATISLQNYFRMYSKLAGMTGTAATEEAEFVKTYDMDVIKIDPNKKSRRKDMDDLIYLSKRAKFDAVAKEIQRLNAEGRPVLIGTADVETSEWLDSKLKSLHIAHSVLNARLHQQEAAIVANAGQKGAVTISTNMAGRGTDIKLGPGVAELGGLAIIGTEHFESRRIDNQLRGRAGRQGDPGSSRFYVSLEDNLMRLFGDSLSNRFKSIGFGDAEFLAHPMLTKSIEKAQQKVEEIHFGSRKRLLEYDDVMNSQRSTIYLRRRHALYGDLLSIDLAHVIEDLCAVTVDENYDNYDNFTLDLNNIFGCSSPFFSDEFLEGNKEQLIDRLYEFVYDNYKKKMVRLSEDTFPAVETIYNFYSANDNSDAELIMGLPFISKNRRLGVAIPFKRCYENKQEIARAVERGITIAVIDNAWKEHLRALDDLKQAVQNAAYEQKDPLVIYKLESFNLFDQLLDRINREIISFLCHCKLPELDLSHLQPVQLPESDVKKLQTGRTEGGTRPGTKGAAPIRVEKKVGRNDPCPCGSGKKYKNCHGQGE